eukprot:CAMPEP_0114120090 /NCGR_PEP_ID=MMETSP0043_2-20121206/6461_1 /TAXON_ID=464988 /ORGANISM="Hemiselmis andersenii, Strain CCMP644" /LENGTH=52 /DNA_ID=CAMNT_0001212685 /DNA_START=21 /DNA_END=179 /DNA_ORIENTATION=-
MRRTQCLASVSATLAHCSFLPATAPSASSMSEGAKASGTISVWFDLRVKVPS